jgi:multisubunit Na+/H+ antiporter MnhG subunit
MKNPTPETRGKIYVLVAALISVLTVLGVVRADEFDAEQIANTIGAVIVLATTIMARLNVKL